MTRNVYWSRPSVCLSVLRRIPTLLHGPDVTCGMVGVPSSCALSIGRIAIGACVSSLQQYSAEREMSASACNRPMHCVIVAVGRTRRYSIQQSSSAQKTEAKEAETEQVIFVLKHIVFQ